MYKVENIREVDGKWCYDLISDCSIVTITTTRSVEDFTKDEAKTSAKWTAERMRDYLRRERRKEFADENERY